MKAFRRRPYQENQIRHEIANQRRSFANLYSGKYAALPTQPNKDELDFQDEGFAVSFTKGLPHNEFGQLKNKEDYINLVNQINQQDAENFDTVARGLSSPPKTRRFLCEWGKRPCHEGGSHPRVGVLPRE